MSTTNAGLAKKIGYTNVKVYLEGEPAWSEQGYHLEAANEFVAKGNIVLIDLRDGGKAIAGRIPRSVSVPYDKLEHRIKDIPQNAPVVLYSDSMEEVLEAYDDLKNEGYAHLSVVKGNFKGWVASGGAVETGPIASNEIAWKRILGKGEVSVKEFKDATEGKLPNVMVIDARTKEEVAELGIFKNTVNIPLDEIPTRLKEFPKDKKIFVHCSTGARADQAYQELVKNGFDARFLLLNISDAECDCPIIRP